MSNSTPLDADAVRLGLAALPGWTGGPAGIAKTFMFPDAAEAERFAAAVALAADQRDHHPDLEAEGSTVILVLSTHSAGGVTQLDLDAAAAFEALAAG